MNIMKQYELSRTYSPGKKYFSRLSTLGSQKPQKNDFLSGIFGLWMFMLVHKVHKSNTTTNPIARKMKNMNMMNIYEGTCCKAIFSSSWPFCCAIMQIFHA